MNVEQKANNAGKVAMVLEGGSFHASSPGRVGRLYGERR